ncbi:MAG: RNA polymerase sigma factor [Candidatus Rifleibacteriota bacterium]
MDSREFLKNWFAEYHTDFLQFMTCCTQDYHLASDILQETYVKAYLKFHLFDQSKGTLKNWLYRIAVNHYRDHLRKMKRINEISLDFLDSHFSETETDIEEPKFTSNELKQALAGISPGKRAIILLSLNHNHGEIAEILDIPAGTVKSRLFYARKSLIKRLNEIKGEVSNE